MSSATSVSTDPVPRQALGARHRLLLFLVVAVVQAISPSAMVTDSLYTVPVAQSIVHQGRIGLGEPSPAGSQAPYGTVRVRGQLYPRFPWAVSLFVMPVTLVLSAAHAVGVGHGPGRVADWRIGVVAMSIVVALAAVVMESIARRVLTLGGWSKARWLPLAAAVVFAFGTAAWSTASRSAWQHGPSMLCLVVGLWAVLRIEEGSLFPAIAGFAFAAAYTVRPTNILAVAAFGLWVLVRHRRKVPAFAAGAAAALVPFAAVNLVAYGQVLPAYFRSGTFQPGARPLQALAGGLVSPSRGLLLFDPVLLLAGFGLVVGLRRRALRGLWVVLVAIVVAHWMTISFVPHWWGGWTYGPRLFSDMVPFLVVLALPAVAALGERDRPPVTAWLAVSALVTASFVINAEGAWTWSSWCWNATPSVDSKPSRVWDWSDPQFVAGARGIAKHGMRAEVQPGIAAYACPA